MTERGPDEGELPRSVERYRARRERAGRPASLARSLAAVGSLGWLVALPALGGVALGRWLDARLSSGVTYTAAGLALGVALGAWLLASSLARHGRTP